MPTDLSPRQARDLRTLLAGVPLAHYVDEGSWYLLRGDRTDRVLKRDAELYRQRGWIERVGFEDSVPMEMYALTPGGRAVAARAPEAHGLPTVGADEPLPVMVLPIVWGTHEPPGGWDRTYVEVPLTQGYLDLLTSRQRLAEYLAAVESDFDAVHFDDQDARLLSVRSGSVSHGALQPLESEQSDYAFLSAPLDEVRETSTDIELHEGLLSMVVTDVAVYWKVEIDFPDAYEDEADAGFLLTALIQPDELAAAARDFLESSYDDDAGLGARDADEEDEEEAEDEEEPDDGDGNGTDGGYRDDADGGNRDDGDEDEADGGEPTPVRRTDEG